MRHAQAHCPMGNSKTIYAITKCNARVMMMQNATYEFVMINFDIQLVAR